MRATCEWDGVEFDAQRVTARYCSTRCRVAASRARAQGRPSPADEHAAPPPPPPPAPPAVPAAASPVVPPDPAGGGDVPLLVAATISELAAANRLSTTLGQQAVKLAERMVSRSETGSAVASLSRELRATMAAAVAGAGQGGDPLDEFTKRRLNKASGG